MCRDKGYTATKGQHIVRFGLEKDDYYQRNYHQLSGTTGLPVVIYDGVESKNTAVDALWGLVPTWSRSLEEGLKMANRAVNARAETVETSRLYKPLFERGQRCLIPCTHYFEHHWLQGGRIKVPFAISSRQEEIFTIPGLYETWTDHKTGEVVLSYTMLTTAGNALLKKVHNGGANPGRMPLVIPLELEALWLSAAASPKELRDVLTYKIPAKGLRAWPVNTIRGKKALSGPQALEPVEQYKSLLR